MKEHITSTAIPTHALKTEALASMSASFDQFCLAAVETDLALRPPPAVRLAPAAPLMALAAGCREHAHREIVGCTFHFRRIARNLNVRLHKVDHDGKASEQENRRVLDLVRRCTHTRSWQWQQVGSAAENSA